jgi:hypothetical protein
MDYLWDFWYSSKWTSSTLQRFERDVETLRKNEDKQSDNRREPASL